MPEIKPDSGETQELLARIGAGEAEAFNRLFVRYQPWLRRLVELRLDGRMRARLDPSDVVQETQLEAFRRLGGFVKEPPMPFRLWLRKTLEERLRMAERRHLETRGRTVRRELTLPETSSNDGRQLAGADPTPSQQFAQDELGAQVREAIAGLEELDREILLMRSYEGLSYGEIGYILEIDEAAARKRHGRALLRLHGRLTDRGFTESQF